MKCLQIDGQLDGQTDAGEFPYRKKSSFGPLDYVYNIYIKGPSNLDSRYPSMPEPTVGLGDPLVPRSTDILSSNTCPGHSGVRI